MKYPTGYSSDCANNTAIEMTSLEGFSEYLPGCGRIKCVLNALAKVSPDTPHPLVVRESFLRPEIEKELASYPRNEGRGDRIPRFLVVDLDSFRSFLMDANAANQAQTC